MFEITVGVLNVTFADVGSFKMHICMDMFRLSNRTISISKIRFHGVKVCNSIPDNLKDKPLSNFKRHLTESLLDDYSTQK